MGTVQKEAGLDEREWRTLRDMLSEPGPYEEYGVYVPHSLLLTGVPRGCDASRFARAFIRITGMKACVCQARENEEEWIADMQTALGEAIRHAPSILYLKDLQTGTGDKEVQGGVQLEMDSVENFRSPCPPENLMNGIGQALLACTEEARAKRVFILATCTEDSGAASFYSSCSNSIEWEPYFDWKINCSEESALPFFTSTFLPWHEERDGLPIQSGARVLEDCGEVNPKTMESLIQSMGIRSACERADKITLARFMEAFLTPCGEDNRFHGDGSGTTLREHEAASFSQIRDCAAARAALAELLFPDSVQFISVASPYLSPWQECAKHPSGLFSVTVSAPWSVAREEKRMLCLLAGPAYLELKYGVRFHPANSEGRAALRMLRRLVEVYGAYGLRFCRAQSVSAADTGHELPDRAREQFIRDKLEERYRCTKAMLKANAQLVESLSAALALKWIVYGDEIQRMKSNCAIHI